MQIRVHDLAKELGVTSKELLLKCSNYGEFVKSASSTLPPRLVIKLREDFGERLNPVSAEDFGASADIRRAATGDGDGGFATAYERARRASRPANTSNKPGAIENAIFRYAIDPRRNKLGSYTPEERDRAERLAKMWAATWLSDLTDWIRVSGGEHSDLAVRFSQEGLVASEVELRLGFGRIDPTQDTIFNRVARGTMGFKDAVRQVQDFRRSERSTGS
ncbi:translation initiation factor IF-2 N-terminal domain-containing protein [Mycolicibacterium hodleri]|uniref:Translation initiation factor IF-2 N-terminal domain-containing protein n=1 Tax=Mycolicibacterium hodleri TaxID=49897 RepID=A0A502DN19_9MYCO|nr:hypothetical protein EAH80_29580 [Mycolicibacterium hodleri]